MRVTLAFLFAATLFSCAIKESKTFKPGITYTAEHFKLASKKCGIDSTAGCASYEVNYPVFSGLDAAVAHRLMTKINASVSMGNPEAHDWNMQRIAEDFIRGYEEFQTESPELGDGDWYYKADVAVEVLQDTLISLSIHDEYFTGGAHGGAGTYFININPKTGKDVSLDDVLRSGYRSHLIKTGEQLFRQVRELPDTTSFVEYGFEFPDDQFQLTDNYGFTGDGITFVYNSYEIGPYVLGPTTIVIPYEKLKDWLK
jgi:hypothetical protein